ncbi:hypothetical protein [Microbacterium sp.]|uniref:hypothetical protein n=1 Tax=Microbacterium sp. TaxID=51671 RepID=UPI00281186E9|nr:hypothetical protein [Microbacterium sp.]
MTATWLRSKPAIWLLTGVLLACAWGVSKITLPEDAASAPFPTAAQLGELATARDLEVTIDEVRAAKRVTDSTGWSAEGTWLVVDLEASAVLSQGSVLGLHDLVIGERTFTATERGTTFRGQALIPGVPREGSLAFELPADALHGQATLRLGAPSGPRLDAPLDGIIELRLDLDRVTRHDEITLRENGWARR